MPPKKTNNPVLEEKAAESEAEPMAHHSPEASVDASATNLDEEAEKALTVEEGADADQAVLAEVAAITEDNETAKELNKKPAKKAAKAVEVKKAKRSAKYLKAREHLEAGKLYPLQEAIDLVKKMSMSKFDGAVEIHVRLIAKKSKGSTESSKGTFDLPHGSGKTPNIIVLDENKIDEIAKTKKIDFDIALASPELMPKVAKIAKILGPKGKMPDPKSGTVTTDPAKTIKELTSGKTTYRIDSSNNVHQMIGRVSWESEKIAANASAVLGAWQKSRLAAVYLVASISPSVPVDLSKI